MALTTEDVRKIAALARLRFTPEEETRFAGQLGAVVDYIDQLQQFEAGGAPEPPEVPPEVNPPEHEAEDRPHACLPREAFLANAPAAMDGFLLVPEVKASEAADA